MLILRLLYYIPLKRWRSTMLIVNDLRIISVISGMELYSGLKCGQEKLGKTGFEFSDNLAWGRGRVAGAWPLASPRFAFCRHWIISSELWKIVIMSWLDHTCLCKSNPVPGMTSSDSIVISTTWTDADYKSNTVIYPGAWQGASDEPTGLKRRSRGHPNAHAYAHASAVANLAHKWVASPHHLNPLELRIYPVFTPSCIVIRKQTGKEASLIQWLVILPTVACDAVSANVIISYWELFLWIFTPTPFVLHSWVAFAQ